MLSQECVQVNTLTSPRLLQWCNVESFITKAMIKQNLQCFSMNTGIVWQNAHLFRMRKYNTEQTLIIYAIRPVIEPRCSKTSYTSANAIYCNYLSVVLMMAGLSWVAWRQKSDSNLQIYICANQRIVSTLSVLDQFYGWHGLHTDYIYVLSKYTTRVLLRIAIRHLELWTSGHK